MKDQITIPFGDEKKTIKMTFGLLNEICKIAGDAEGAVLLAVDTDLREASLKALLSDRDESGNITSDLNLFSLPITPKGVNELLQWAGEHTLDFFVSAMEKAQTNGQTIEDRMKKIQSAQST